jgi:hypothetical protein
MGQGLQTEIRLSNARIIHYDYYYYTTNQPPSSRFCRVGNIHNYNDCNMEPGACPRPAYTIMQRDLAYGRSGGVHSYNIHLCICPRGIWLRNERLSLQKSCGCSLHDGLTKDLVGGSSGAPYYILYPLDGYRYHHFDSREKIYYKLNEYNLQRCCGVSGLTIISSAMLLIVMQMRL